MANNRDVVNAWVRGRVAAAGNLSTNGNEIYSYQLQIGETREGKKVAFDYTSAGLREFYSMTTSKHVGMF